MRTIKGPGVFLAQFAGDKDPFNSIEGLADWAAGKGFQGVQIPTWDRRVIDLKAAAENQAYCDDYAGRLAEHGLVVTELASHLQGQLVALHPAYDHPADSFAAATVRGNPQARQQWAVEQLHLCAKASRRFGIRPARHLFRLVALAIPLSLSAMDRRADRGWIRRAGTALAANPRRL